MDVVFHPENLVQAFGLIVCGCLPLLVGTAFVISRKYQVEQIVKVNAERKLVISEHAGFIKDAIKKAMRELAKGNQQEALRILKDVQWSNRSNEIGSLALQIIEHLQNQTAGAGSDTMMALFRRTESAINKVKGEQ